MCSASASKTLTLPAATLDWKVHTNSILHTVAQHGNATQLAELIGKLKAANSLLQFLFTHNSDGFTPLHLAVLHNTAGVLAVFLNEIGAELARDAATTADTKSRLPLQLICAADGDSFYLPHPKDRNFKKVNDKVNVLLQTTITPSIPDLTYKLSADTLIKRGGKYKNSYLLINQCCEAANSARTAITQSYTHPAANVLSEDEFMALHNEINTMKEVHKKKNGTGDYNTFKDWQHLEKNILEVRKGNCVEFAYYVLYLLYSRYGIEGEIVKLVNGNHWFVVINRDHNHPDGWGPHALIIDAWSGDIFFANERMARLKNLYYFIKENPNDDNKARAYNTVGRLTHFHSFTTVCTTQKLNPPAFKKSQ